MADKIELQTTPRDSEYGLPLPIAPVLDLALDAAPDALNDHHAWHPSNDERLMQPPQEVWVPRAGMPSPKAARTLGGWALRNSRLQRVNRRLHNYRDMAYHRFYAGPEVPADEDEQFQLVVLACAGLIPREGLDLSTGEPRVVTMSDEQMELLRTPLDGQLLDIKTFGMSSNRCSAS